MPTASKEGPGQGSRISNGQVARKVLLVDDHPIVRMGASDVLTHVCGMQVIAECSTVEDALLAFERERPDLMLVDLNLATESGLDLIQVIRGRDRDVRILVWTIHGTREFAVRALKAGANGFLDKAQSPETLVEAVRAVLKGDVYLPSNIRSNVLRSMAASGKMSILPEEALSKRELEVFKLIGEGKGSAEIARMLGVSVKTIDAHRANVKQKLSIASGRELAQRAILWASQGV